MISAEELAPKMYYSYGDETEHKNYQGLPMPLYEDLPPKIKSAWEVAAERAINEMFKDTTNWRHSYNERENSEIDFAGIYVDKFNHGTDGHSRLNLIARLTATLDALTT